MPIERGLLAIAVPFLVVSPAGRPFFSSVLLPFQHPKTPISPSGSVIHPVDSVSLDVGREGRVKRIASHSV